MVEAANGCVGPEGEEDTGSKSGVPGGDESIASIVGEDGAEDDGELGRDDMEERERVVARAKRDPNTGARRKRLFDKELFVQG